MLSANNPDRNQSLWILLPDGAVKKLFPLAVHESQGLIDSPAGQMDKGAVTEPNVSEDGRRLYFSFFHDTTYTHASGSQLGQIQYKGADLYALDLGPLLDDFTTDPSTLTTTRLTTREYAGNGQQTTASKLEHALNPTSPTITATSSALSTCTPWRCGRAPASSWSTSATSADSRTPTSIWRPPTTTSTCTWWTSRKTARSTRDLSFSTTRRPRRSHRRRCVAASPSRTRRPLRRPRMWHMQGIDSEGRWFPILGYGIHPELFHLGSFCVDTKSGPDSKDLLVATRYYNANNEGFGSLWTQDLSVIGQNTYDVQTSWAKIPRVVGSTYLTLGAQSNDDPSAKQGGVYIGKFTTPRCGRPDDLFFAYTQTSANGRLNDPEGNRTHLPRSHRLPPQPVAVPPAGSGQRRNRAGPANRHRRRLPALQPALAGARSPVAGAHRRSGAEHRGRHRRLAEHSRAMDAGGAARHVCALQHRPQALRLLAGIRSQPRAAVQSEPGVHEHQSGERPPDQQPGRPDLHSGPTGLLR